MINLDKAARKFLPLSEATYLILASRRSPGTATDHAGRGRR